jgi:uncharacterized membrane protein YhaH (DUF805 family)
LCLAPGEVTYCRHWGASMNPLDLLFGFQGRVGRGQFWLALLIWAVLFFVLMVAVVVVTPTVDALFSAALILYILIVLLLIPVGVKRLHDRNKRGWWILVFLGVPTTILVLGAMIAGDEPSSDPLPVWVQVVQYVGLAILLWALVELGFIRGTIGSNPHGPDPVAPKPAKH